MAEVFPTQKYPELFFGFVAPIGTETDFSVKKLTEKLQSFGYYVVPIKVTDVFPKLQPALGWELQSEPLEKRFETYINFGDKLRQEFSDDSFLAYTCLQQIIDSRGQSLMPKELAFVLILATVMANPAFAGDPAPMSKTKRVFDVTRDGSKIGTDTIEIEQRGDATIVNCTTHISVTILSIEAYRLDHHSSETWKGEQLISFTSKTDDHGTKHSVSATTSNEKIRFDIDGKASEVLQKIIPSNFWNKAFLATGQLFDDTNGKLLSIKVSDLGGEPLTMHGVKYQTNHYRIEGDLKRDLWFDDNGLVRLKMPAPDGSKISFDLQS
jgi:hypothetical protein